MKRTKHVIAALWLLAVTVLLLWQGDRALSESRSYGSVTVGKSSPHAASPTATALLQRRPVYRYSLVKGGVRDVGELVRASDRDPQLREHYRDFDTSRARVGSFENAVMRYVSYRKDGKILWTRRPILIRASQRVLSDGKNEILARCGNRAARKPQTPVAFEEPESSAFEQVDPAEPPVFDAGPALEQAALSYPIPPRTVDTIPSPIGGWLDYPAGPVGGGVLIPIAPLPPGDGGKPNAPGNPTDPGNPGDPGTPPPAIPEPMTLVMVASGLVALRFLVKHD